ncbi:uncharacterized protein LOC125657735 [Ostrea edulis]|uniref:uncharacterized protein LOC125657735 n=1 Tax=Ostrea edulis TaxID=37623 RepID=UPI002094951B|nr:uncharacterized protein LOC125657735 [Ostrea edulis]
MDDVDGLCVKSVLRRRDSEKDVDDHPTCDVTDNGNTNDDEFFVKERVGKQYLQRLNTQDSIELDESRCSSPIYVRHSQEDQDPGDPLGGFLCTISRKDGTFIHALCTLDDVGILAKHLQVREKDILVSLDSTHLLDSESKTHEEVLRMFTTLPLGQPIIMIVYNRKSENFTSIEFQLEGVKGGNAEKIDIIVREESVKLMAQPPKVLAFKFPNESKFLVNDNGQLSFDHVEDFRIDCSCHFIVNTTMDRKDWHTVYRYQVQKDKTKYLGINGNRLDLVDGSANTKQTLFRQEMIQREILLKPCAHGDMAVFYNRSRGMLELVSRDYALDRAAYGIRMVPTSCSP